MEVYFLDWRGMRLRVREGDTVIGRGLGCEVHIDDPTSSRRHAAVRLADGQLTVRDLGSRNGTFLNGDRVEGETGITVGDRVLVGESLFTVGRGEPSSVVEGKLSLPPAVSEGLALVEQGGRRDPPQEVTQPHVGTIEVIESLLHSPHAEDEPHAIASMVQSSVDRLLANLERRDATLTDPERQRLLALVDAVRAWFPDGSFDAWKDRVRQRLGL